MTLGCSEMEFGNLDVESQRRNGGVQSCTDGVREVQRWSVDADR